MGYTHYWRFTEVPDKTKFHKAVGECVAVLEFLPKWVELGDVYGERGTGPEMNDCAISFNGIGTAGHEGFYIGLDSKVGEFSFCKTNGKGYDSAVCACLLVFKDVFGDGFSIETDGIVADTEKYMANEGWKIAEMMFNEYRKSVGNPEISDFDTWVD